MVLSDTTEQALLLVPEFYSALLKIFIQVELRSH